MSDATGVPDLPGRPRPPLSWRDRVGDWVQWIGVGRLVSSAVVVLAVVAAVYWLVAPPAVASEAVLPRADTASSTAVGDTHADPAVTTTMASTTVVVHVAGAVIAPGVYELAGGARAIDAVERAGGVAVDADVDAVNLAAPLVDGQRLYIPHVGEVAPPLADPSAGGTTVSAGPINVNRATASELEALPGVGPATAAAIIAHRTEHGPFASVDDLGDVTGIGDAKLAALRGLVTV